jgi:hypothetical protein
MLLDGISGAKLGIGLRGENASKQQSELPDPVYRREKALDLSTIIAAQACAKRGSMGARPDVCSVRADIALAI